MRFLNLAINSDFVKEIWETSGDELEVFDTDWFSDGLSDNVSLLDLFDLSEDPEDGDAVLDVGDGPLETPPCSPPFCPPSPPPSSPASVDLYCEEELPEEDENIILDYPEIPGRDCLSCHQHRMLQGDILAMCSLCYMRRISQFVYSKYHSMFCNFPFHQ